METSQIKERVRENYAQIAQRGTSCCGPKSSCCDDSQSAQKTSRGIGYSDAEMAAVPEGANLGLGCGNPVALASLSPGEVVLDLGSGAGFDCFLAADCVGAQGRVIGVDMTPEMIARARENAEKGNYDNVEFRLGEIEHLPVADGTVDAILSNCVINLVPDKRQAFLEAFRVLKPGGRLMVADLVLQRPLPEAIRQSVNAYVGCIAGASLKNAYLADIQAAGFHDVCVVEERAFGIEYMLNDPTAQAIVKKSNLDDEEIDEAAQSVLSVKVQAIKPEDKP